MRARWIPPLSIAIGACGLVGVAVAAGATGTDRSALDDATGSAGTAPLTVPATVPATGTVSGSGPADGTGDDSGVIVGELDGSAPAAHQIEVAAGDAVRLWAVPTSDAMNDIDDWQLPFADGMAIGVGVDPATAPNLWASMGWEEDDEMWLFSDYEPGVDLGDPSVGFLAFYSSSGASNDYTFQLDPPFFSCADRGLGASEELGAWGIFISPIETTYTIFVTGLGGYELHIETQPAPKAIATDPAAEFPYHGATFAELIEAHSDFLLDRTFYPTDELFTDTNRYESESRCLTGVVA